jgi:LmbE family N-acetylglucosaminyl deacetylase
MKAICMVAHPDDCVIFGYPYIYNHSDWDWTVGYLTYTSDSERGQELARFWNSRGINTVFLCYEDNPQDYQSKSLKTWSPVQALNSIRQLVHDFDVVLSHSAEGDYGHVHHQLVNQAVEAHPGLVTFAAPGTGTVTFTLPATAYNLDELPQHRDIIAGFHTESHTNSYQETLP